METKGAYYIEIFNQETGELSYSTEILINFNKVLELYNLLVNYSETYHEITINLVQVIDGKNKTIKTKTIPLVKGD